MIGIVSPDGMRELERNAIDAGVSEAQLVERAATEISGFISRNVGSPVDEPLTVIAVAGPGNNGVDAIVAAAMLTDLGWRAATLMVDREDLSEHPDLVHYLDKLNVTEDLSDADVILDGIYGNSGRTGLPDHVSCVLADITDARSASDALVVAIDCPTGTNTATGEVADMTVSADITLCISHPKTGMLRQPALDKLGELVMLDIGLGTHADVEGASAHMVDRIDVRAKLPARAAGAHKSQVGGLLIAGGAPGYFGAPRLAGEAALRSGCGYVGLAVPRSIVSAIASAVPELIFHPTSDADGRSSATVVTEALTEGGRYDAVVIGPGLGRDEVATRFLSELFESTTPAPSVDQPSSVFGIPRRTTQQEDSGDADLSAFPLVIDADALNWLAGRDGWPGLLDGRRCVLTPHVGEMARLLDIDPGEITADAWEVARESARTWGQTVVLKCAVTCAASPSGHLVIAPRSTPELATPGTGDMLSGIIGAFIAQGLSPFDAACSAIWVGAEAGRLARVDLGTRAVITRDAIERLPSVLRSLESPAYDRLLRDR